MEFLLDIDVNFTPEVDADRRADLVKQEHEHVRSLVAKGRVVRIWRVPGRLANWAVWQAADATQLHELISALPLFPWLRITVHPLATHPIEMAASNTSSGGDRS